MGKPQNRLRQKCYILSFLPFYFFYYTQEYRSFLDQVPIPSWLRKKCSRVLCLPHVASLATPGPTTLPCPGTAVHSLPLPLNLLLSVIASLTLYTL